MEHLLARYAPITLAEMEDIRLMNRTDTKFVTSTARLMDLLALAAADYRVQHLTAADGAHPDCIGRPLLPYSTTYFDTADRAMYYAHQHGHAGRQKLRVRSYDSSGRAFLEVKTKDNHGRTHKKRTPWDAPATGIPFGVGTQLPSLAAHRDFVTARLHYPVDALTATLANSFHRITLVNNARTERLTIDLDLTFRDVARQRSVAMPDVAIIELKRDGRCPSPIADMLRRLRIQPLGFSKYCIGSALTDPSLRLGRFKDRIRVIERIVHGRLA